MPTASAVGTCFVPHGEKSGCYRKYAQDFACWCGNIRPNERNIVPHCGIRREEKMEKRSTDVQSLQRAFDILETIGNSAKGVSLREITEKTGLPKTTVYRLLGNLESRGYVRCTSGGHYELGLKLLMMSQRVEQKFQLKHVARPIIQQLRDYSGETVHLGVLENNRVMYMDSVESHHPIRLVARVGATNSIHCTSLGKALLINRDDKAIAKILDLQVMEKRTAYTITHAKAFLAQMADVRKLGYALDDQESAEDCRCVGAPIYDHQGQVVGAISISGPVSRFSLTIIHTSIAPKLLQATRQISQFLGLIAE